MSDGRAIQCELALAWGQNDYQIRRIALYVRTRYEPIQLHPSIEGWESYIAPQRFRGLGSWSLVVASSCGLLLGSQLLAIGLGLMRAHPQLRRQQGAVAPVSISSLDVVLLVVDVLAVGIVCWVTVSSVRSRKTPAPVDPTGQPRGPSNEPE